MTRYVLSRLIQTALVIFVVTVLVMLILHSSGDPVRLLLPEEATPAMVEALRARLGLDQPLWRQYLMFVDHAFTGELESYRFRQPVFNMAFEYFTRTFYLVIVSIVLTIIIAVPLGSIAAYRRGTVVDGTVQVLSYLGQSLPLFLLAIALIQVFAVNLRILPVSGTSSARHWVLPVATLVLYNLAVIVRMTRSSMLSALGEDYVRTAWAKGLSTFRVVSRHGLRNASGTIVSVLGVRLSELLGGILILEVVFSWPGLGWLFYTAITQRDIPLVLGGAVVTTIVVGVLNLVVDILHRIIDPRVREA